MYVKALLKGLSWGSQGSNPGLWHTQSLSYSYLILTLSALGTDFFIFYFQQTGAKKHSRFTHMALVILLISPQIVLIYLLTILFFCWFVSFGNHLIFWHICKVLSPVIWLIIKYYNSCSFSYIPGEPVERFNSSNVFDNGDMYSFKVFREPLSNTEITDLYNNYCGAYGKYQADFLYIQSNTYRCPRGKIVNVRIALLYRMG